MAQLKRTVAFLVVVSMMLAGIVGCTSTAPAATVAPTAAPTQAATDAPTDAPPANPLAEKVDISFALWGIGSAISDQPDAIRDILYEKFNFTFVPVNLTWDDYTQKIQIWAASDQLPDIFAADAVGTTNAKKWMEEGIIQALPDDLSLYPNVAKMMGSAGMEIYKMPIGDPNGKFYSMPRLNHMDAEGWCTDTGVHIRKDWMANVGVTAEPTTMDEFIDLMVKFANNDPDKNSKNDTIGLTCYNASWLQWFMLNYEPGTNGWIKGSDGKWMPAFMTQNTLEGIKALKKLYDAGGLDKDFATLKGDEGRDKYVSNKAGAYAHDVTVSTLQNYVGQAFEKINTGVKYPDVLHILKPFKATDGNYYRLIAKPGWSETYINAKCDAVKVDRVLRIFDYVLDIDGEGFKLTHYGIEGTDWNVVDGKIVLADYKDASGNVTAPIMKYPISNIGFMAMWSGVYQAYAPNPEPIYQEMFQVNEDWLMANAKPQPVSLVVPMLDVPSADKATFNLSDLIIKCVLSDDAEATYNTEISNYRAGGYDTYIEELNAAADAAGIQ